MKRNFSQSNKTKKQQIATEIKLTGLHQKNPYINISKVYQNTLDQKRKFPSCTCLNNSRMLQSL